MSPTRSPVKAFCKKLYFFIAVAFCSSLAVFGQAPRFQNIQITAPGQILLRVEVTPGKTYRLERSSTLSGWGQLTTKTATGSLLEFFDAASSAAGFYRVSETTVAGAVAASDQFGGARELSGTFALGNGSNAGATSESGEPNHSWFDPGKTSVWWKWTAPASGRATVSLIGTYFETLLAVYSGSNVNSLQTVAKNRQFSKLISFDAQAGVTYMIAVAGHFDATGNIQLALQLTPPTASVAATTITGASIFLDETSDPNFPMRIIDVSADGWTWTDRDNGGTDAVEFGTVLGYNATGATSALTLASNRPTETNTIAYAFTFDSNSTGNYSYTIDGVPSGSGRFANFRDARANRAPPSLARTVLQTVRTRTSIGTSGQRHVYTFGWTGDFHDSDGEEHSSGSYTYSASGQTSTVHLSYTGPTEVAGDNHQILLKFVSSTHGTYSGEYRRNDGAVIQIEGDFILAFHL
jgi:hypothetical protein